MISLETIAEKSEIKFPKPINKSEFEELMFAVLTNLSYKIAWTLEADQEIPNRKLLDYINPRVKDTKIRYYGIIKSPNTFVSFSTKNAEKDDEKLSSIVFGTVPEYAIQQQPVEEIAVWDSVRKVAEDYFSKR